MQTQRGMNNLVFKHGDWAVKINPGRPPGWPENLVNRSRILRNHGIRTPRAYPGPTDKSVQFAWLDAQTGAEYLDSLFGRFDPSHPSVHSLLTRLVRQVRQLHRIPTGSIRCGQLDPTRRIMPRLSIHSDTGQYHKLVSDCTQVIGDLDDARHHVVVHGDLHIGQFLVEPNGQIWFIDFDDLAAGPIESDLANFCAHLSSRDITGDEYPLCAWIHWSEMITAIYQRETGYMPDPSCMQAFGALAMLRRGLKLQEQAHPRLPRQTINRLFATALALGKIATTGQVRTTHFTQQCKTGQ
jgi:aminoglycoside phosphotransferase (APT) family kinase protein